MGHRGPRLARTLAPPEAKIEYLQSENRLLKEKLKGKRLRFTDAERALLARKAKQVGRKTLLTLDTA